MSLSLMALWIMTHWEEVMATVLALHALALAIVNLTPTPVDNRWLAKFYAVVEALAGVVTHKAKDNPAHRQLKEELDAYRNRPANGSVGDTLDRM